MVLGILNVDQEFLVMVSRRGHTQNLADDVDTDVNLLVEVGDLVIYYVESCVAEVGMTKPVIHFDRIIDVLVTGRIALVVELGSSISRCHHVNYPIITLISKLCKTHSDLIHHR